ncbi:MAG: glycoside hydrolase family 127 protein, partial [Chitinophagaceae bacterium]|nr:glycoside hydrolase family 127 protein [Chitinophagaceae bacterium]
PLKNGNIGVSLKSGYPWKGNNTIEITSSPRGASTINIRIPGWLKEPVAEGLYKYRDTAVVAPVITLNGKPIIYKEEKGYAVITRPWKKGDVINFETPMRVREVISRPELKQNENRIALQYGPMVYCVEGADNNNSAFNFVLSERPGYTVSFKPELLNGINTINFNANIIEIAADGRSANTVQKQLTAIPYYAWNNRGPNEMQVWLPVTIGKVTVVPD